VTSLFWTTNRIEIYIIVMTVIGLIQRVKWIQVGRLKMQDRKMTDRKMTDKSAGLENAGLENDGQKCTAGK